MAARDAPRKRTLGLEFAGWLSLVIGPEARTRRVAKVALTLNAVAVAVVADR